MDAPTTQAAPASPAPSQAPSAAAPQTGGGQVDISRSTIIVLVLLTLVISVLGTWTVLSETSSLKVPTYVSGPQKADVQLTILSEEEYRAQQLSRAGLSTGQVIFNIDRSNP